MKSNLKLRLLLFFTALVLYTTTLGAQEKVRHVDMELIVSLPEDGKTYVEGPAPIKLEQINHGPDTLYKGDTLVYTDAGVKQSYYVETDNLYLVVLDSVVAPGARAIMYYAEEGLTLPPLSNDKEEVEFCMTLLHHPAVQIRYLLGGNPIVADYRDDNTRNNRACSRFFIEPDEPSFLSDQQLVTNSLGLYPNPVVSRLQIPVPEEISGLKAVKVYDVLGRVVQKNYYSERSSILQIDLSDLNSGIYIVSLEGNSLLYQGEIVKQ